MSLSMFTVYFVSVSVCFLFVPLSLVGLWVWMGGDGCCWWAVAGSWCLASLRVRVRVRVSLCLCVCCVFVVLCRVSRVVARFFLFVVRHLCLLSIVFRCGVLCCCCCCVVCCCMWLWVCWEEEKGCMHRTRLRVYVQNVSVCTRTTPTCFIHVGLVRVHTGTFLNVHTWVFQCVTRHHTTPHHTTPHRTAPHRTAPHTHHTTTTHMHDHNHTHSHTRHTTTQPTNLRLNVLTTREPITRSRHSND